MTFSEEASGTRASVNTGSWKVLQLESIQYRYKINGRHKEKVRKIGESGLENREF